MEDGPKQEHECQGCIPGTWVVCGESPNLYGYCSVGCQRAAEAKPTGGLIPQPTKDQREIRHLGEHIQEAGEIIEELTSWMHPKCECGSPATRRVEIAIIIGNAPAYCDLHGSPKDTYQDLPHARLVRRCRAWLCSTELKS